MVARRRSSRRRWSPASAGRSTARSFPDAIGYEAGQSAFGDVYAWFKELLSWPLGSSCRAELAPPDPAARERLVAAWTDRIIPELERAAPPSRRVRRALLALDWMNGRRTPDANQRLTGAITGIQLGTDAPRIYRSLVEATAFGSRAIVERFRAQGIRIDSAIAIGGVAKKSPFVMQTVADVMNMDVTVSGGRSGGRAGRRDVRRHRRRPLSRASRRSARDVRRDRADLPARSAERHPIRRLYDDTWRSGPS